MCIIDYALSSSQATPKSGYNFLATGSPSSAGNPNDQFVLTAQPSNLNTTGVKEFCAVQDNVVRFQTPAGGSGPDTSMSIATCNALSPIGN